jgi:nitrogen fixation protein FixH
MSKELQIMNKKILSIMVLIVVFFVFATPVNASEEEDFLHFEANYGDKSNSHEYDRIPGYGIVAYRVSLTVDPDEITANGISISTISVQLKDRKGNDVKVEDVIINFRTTEGTLSANNAITDKNGRAIVTLTSSTERGIAVIRATSDNALIPDVTKVKFVEIESIPGYGIVAHSVSLTVDPDKIPANGISTSMITAQLKDRKGNDVKVNDVIINFKTTRGILSATSVVTDNNGRAIVTLTSGTKQGTAIIKVKSDNVLIPEVTKVKFAKVNSDKKDHDGEVLGFNTKLEEMMTTFNDAFDEYFIV